MRSGLLAVLSVVVLSACTRGVTPLPAPTPMPPPVVTPAPAPAPVVSRVSIATRHDTARYDVTSTARIVRDSGGRPVEEEIITRAQVAFALERTGSARPGTARDLRSTGRVDGFTISASERVTGARSSAMQGAAQGAMLGSTAGGLSRAPLTVPFDASLNGLNARVAPRPSLVNECDRQEMSAASLVRELLLRLPPVLEVGATWSDTSRVFLCRGGVPVTAQTVATAHVRSLSATAGGTQAVVERDLVIRIEGELATAWRTVAMSGRGTGRQRFVIDAERGRVDSLRSESETRIDVRDSVRPDAGEQSLTQRVVLVAERRP